MNTKAKVTNIPSQPTRKSDSSHSGNVSFTGGGKVSVSVTSIISSDVVQRQVESVKEIAAISSATKSK